jgi:hypothetical protein
MAYNLTEHNNGMQNFGPFCLFIAKKLYLCRQNVTNIKELQLCQY